MKKLIYYVQKLTSSFWFLPLLLIIISIIFAISLIYIDANTDFKLNDEFNFIFSGNADSARSILSVIAGAMIGVAGTVFSITLVVLTLASSQFGPRLLKNFMYDRMNQTVLGLYVSTFIYCLIILSAVRGNENVSFVPNLSVLFAIVLAVVSIIYLILFIHHVSISIQPGRIISSISIEIEKSIDEVLSFDHDTSKKSVNHDKVLAEAKINRPIISNVLNKQSGYLQYIDFSPLLQIASKENLLFTLKYKPGEYLIKDDVLLEVNATSEIEDSVKQEISELFITDSNKTTFQDIEFAIDQIVEVACKALSPGINDPFTAITCIDYLTSSICHLTRANFPSKYNFDKDDELRIVSYPLTFESTLNAAFNQIRQFGAGSPAVLIRLLECLKIIYDFTNYDDQKNAVNRHAEMVLALGKSAFKNEQDFNDLKERWNIT